VLLHDCFTAFEGVVFVIEPIRCSFFVEVRITCFFFDGAMEVSTKFIKKYKQKIDVFMFRKAHIGYYSG
jgi:hypothetical protein